MTNIFHPNQFLLPYSWISEAQRVRGSPPKDLQWSLSKNIQFLFLYSRQDTENMLERVSLRLVKHMMEGRRDEMTQMIVIVHTTCPNIFRDCQVETYIA